MYGTYSIVSTPVGDDGKRIAVVFYRTQSGAEPVREWLRTLSPDDRRVIGIDLKTVEYGWPVEMPVCRPLRNGLWEVRSDLPGGRIARVLFCLRATGNREVVGVGWFAGTAPAIIEV